MSRDLTPLYVEDLSRFAKALRADLQAAPEFPGHQAFLGMIARAAGHRNYQETRAAAATPSAASRDLDRALRVFDARGQMTHWPSATKIQGLCLWSFWAKLPPRAVLSERQVNEILKAGHLFGDHVLLRRSLIDHGLAIRSPDGRAYERIEQRPPIDAIRLISELRNRGM